MMRSKITVFISYNDMYLLVTLHGDEGTQHHLSVTHETVYNINGRQVDSGFCTRINITCALIEAVAR